MTSRFDSLHGCLLGGALGDALGLPFEGLSPARARQIWGDPSAAGLQMCLLPNRGMVSDDTEHALFTARTLMESSGDIGRFERALRGELRGWMGSLPPGVGLATLRAGMKAALFLPKTGVFSAGNGPAMRAPILGAFFREDREQLRQFCAQSTRLTHTDVKAEWGAFAVALAAAQSARDENDGRRFVDELRRHSDNSPAALEMIALAERAVDAASRGESVDEFCRELGLDSGVSGYIFHTVPVVLFCWLRFPDDFRGALESIIAAGGDTDSTAAILGGIIGAGMGADALPADWKSELWDWPNSSAYIQKLSAEMIAALENGAAVGTPRVLLGAPLMRNAFFLCVVLAHAARRLIRF